MKATVIVSVYRDAEALECILFGLQRQTEKDFEVIVAEDGRYDQIDRVCLKAGGLRITHQSQDDVGFRKALAVNRAIAAAKAPYLIFLDGDCIPHHSFVESHLTHASNRRVLAGRRVHLGPKFSARIRADHQLLPKLESKLGLAQLIIPLHLDRVRNVELSHPSPLMHRAFGKKPINIIGCNFSCFREDMLAINGYDEALLGKGGEDDDLHWRFEGLGIEVVNMKFLLVCYHLHHAAFRMGVETNFEQSQFNLAAGHFRCLDGIEKHH